MVTLAAWVGAWIERRSIRLAPSTISGYRGLLRKYITPSDAGSLPLDAIAPEDLVVLLSPIVAAGHTRAAQLCQVVVGAALRDAVRQRVIPWSPMDCVDRIQHKPRLTAWLTPDQAARLLRCAPGRRATPFMSLGCWLCCGLRRGELLGLLWDDVDFAGGWVHVRRQRVRVDGKVLETPPKTLGRPA